MTSRSFISELPFDKLISLRKQRPACVNSTGAKGTRCRATAVCFIQTVSRRIALISVSALGANRSLKAHQPQTHDRPDTCDWAPEQHKHHIHNGKVQCACVFFPSVNALSRSLIQPLIVWKPHSCVSKLVRKIQFSTSNNLSKSPLWSTPLRLI